MAKAKKLTKGQVRRIKANQHKKLQKEEQISWQDSELGDAQEGIVISRFGQHADIENSHNKIFRCNLRRSINSLVCGDNVIWRAGKNSEHSISGIVEAVQERTSVLSRPDVYDGVKPIAANISQIFIISSVLPAFSSEIIDRYLVASTQTGITPIIVLNKVDLLDDDNRVAIEQRLEIYRKIGYQVIYASSVNQNGMKELTEQLDGHTSIFVGQSGVGKSTLVNSLMPELNVLTQTVSENSGLGQHTTTVARLYHFSQGGNLIDSPGIREFGLWHMTAEQVYQGFIEFAEYLGGCKFRDCQHKTDPGCALVAAAQNGEIDSIRLASFQKILTSISQTLQTTRFNS